MTTIQKKKILQKIVDIESDIERLKKARLEVVESGYASATLTSSGGSKSYTRIDVQKITDTINELMKELKSMRNLLKSQTSTTIQTIATIYS